MEITSKSEAVIAHYKDNELVAITHSNGSSVMFKVEEMSRSDLEAFYEANSAKTASQN